MITLKDIESFVKGRPSTIREVFSSLIVSEKEITRNFIRSLEKLIKKYLRSEGFKIEPTANWLDCILLELEIEELMLILESASAKASKSWEEKLFAPFRPWIQKMMGYAIDLDYSECTYEQKAQVGETLVLACLYSHIQDAAD